MSDAELEDAPPERSGCFEQLLMLAAAGALVFVVVDVWLGGRIDRSTPAGSVLNVSGAGGLHGRLLIETETAYYPVYDLMAVEKGTPLVLQERGNGDSYLCDARMQVCGRTSGITLKSSTPKGAR